MNFHKLKRKLRKHETTILLACSTLAICTGLLISSAVSNSTKAVSEATTKPTSESNLVCTKDNKTVYIKMDGDLSISSLRYEIVYPLDEEINEEDLDVYNSIYGVFASLTVGENTQTITIKYNMDKVKLDQIKTDLKDLIKGTVFETIDTLPINYNYFKLVELDNYTCN